MWRPILSKITTLQEVETHWCILDLQEANEALDLKEDAERILMERSKKGGK